MKQAILVICHNKPEQINKLIEIMPSSVFDFFVHVDKKSDILSKINHKNNVHFVENRADVRWGQFSQVDAILRTINAISNVIEYSYVHLISGNDFIVKPIKELIDFFENNEEEYIESNYLDGSSTWSWGGCDRYECYYPQWLIHRPSQIFWRVLRVGYREIVMRTKIFKRHNQPVEKFYGGSGWWSLTGRMISWIKEYLTNNPEYLDFFKHGVCVDEVFFSTLVRYSPYNVNITNNHMRYMKWNELGNNTGGPAVLHVDDIEDMISSQYFFARKFIDMKTIDNLTSRLDEMSQSRFNGKG